MILQEKIPNDIPNKRTTRKVVEGRGDFWLAWFFFLLFFVRLLVLLSRSIKEKKNKKKFTKRIKEKVNKGKEETPTLSIQCREKEEGPVPVDEDNDEWTTDGEVELIQIGPAPYPARGTKL